MVLLQDKQQNIELISWLIQFFDIIENQPIFLDAITSFNGLMINHNHAFTVAA